MVRARPHVITVRLNDRELELYNGLLRSVADVWYSRNKSKAFRALVESMAAYVKDRKARALKESYLRRLEESDFEAPTISHGAASVLVDGPEEEEDLEEAEEIY